MCFEKKEKKDIITCLGTGGFSVASMLHIKLTVDLWSNLPTWDERSID
jgi:hypoxanthine phosphoribosyltransferase